MDKEQPQGTKTSKQVSESHLTKQAIEADSEKLFPGPKLRGRHDLVDLNTHLLRLPTVEEGAHPDYSYSWLSTMQHAKPNFYEAISKYGYTVCTIRELPKMHAVYQTMKRSIDSSLGEDNIVVNEMILCKVHKQDKSLILAENHHHKPMEQAREVFRNYWNQLEQSNGGVRRLTKSELQTPGDNDSSDSADERVFRGQAQSHVNNGGTGISTDGTEIKTFHPKVNHLL